MHLAHLTSNPTFSPRQGKCVANISTPLPDPPVRRQTRASSSESTPHRGSLTLSSSSLGKNAALNKHTASVDPPPTWIRSPRCSRQHSGAPTRRNWGLLGAQEDKDRSVSGEISKQRSRTMRRSSNAAMEVIWKTSVPVLFSSIPANAPKFLLAQRQSRGRGSLHEA